MADILLVTTWDIPCGIAEHSALLKEAVESQSDLTVHPCPGVLAEPFGYLPLGRPGPFILHLNYQAALHSRWTPLVIQTWRLAHPGIPVVITYHDTGVPNSEQCKALYAVADAFVIHEPCEDLPNARYWRMGVCDAVSPVDFTVRNRTFGLSGFLDYASQPVLGTIGFPFPWKHYDQLAKLTAECGWALLLIAPHATPAQIDGWRAANPCLDVRSEFVPRAAALSLLTSCDATAFTYVCHNTGQSGAILQGIAARHPVIALHTCRQFRALYQDPLGRSTIKWAETFEDVKAHLRHVKIQRIDPGIVALAEQESWTRLGQKYVSLYRSLCA